MPRKTVATCLLLGCLAVSAGAHDLFLKFDSYFLQPNSKATVRLFNGTFRRSDGAVARERMRDVSLVTPAGGRKPETVDWRDQGKTTLLNLETGEPGTYVIGVSTRPRKIDLKAQDFNEYLAHDGLPDTLAARKKGGELGRDVRERYSKHVKAIFQVGEARTEDYKTPLGYPVEITPRLNPYSLKAGQTLEVLCTLGGRPIVNQFVIAGRETHGKRSRQLNARTDADGTARFRLAGAGKWYVKFIHMATLDEPQINYESKWASLTFEIE